MSPRRFYSPVTATAPEIGGVAENRIDHEWQRSVVFIQLEANFPLAKEMVSSCNLLAGIVALLVDERFIQAKLPLLIQNEDRLDRLS